VDRLQQMTTFASVVESGSFVRAAAALGLSKAAVSRQVSDLETRLGVRLLQRTTRRLSMTREGESYYVRCKELTAAVDDADAEVGADGGEPAGVLRINAPQTFGVLYLASLWSRFAALHPKVGLDITLSDRVVDLVEEGFDVAVRIGSLPSSALVTRQLATTLMVVCASPGYLRRRGVPAVPGDLLRHDAIAYSLWSARDRWHFEGPQGPTSVKIKPRIHTNSGDTCRRAALDGHGIVLQPDFLVASDLREGTLVELLPGYRSIELGIHVVYPSRKHLPLKVRRLIDFLVLSFATPPWSMSNRLRSRRGSNRRKARSGRSAASLR
jgi:DNA-binding transcriptional LysR family regulator